MKLDLIYTVTEDKLRLPGILYSPSSSTDTCLLIVHGMSGNILENYWGDVLGRTLAKNGIACIYSHNRGYGMVSDPVVLGKTRGAYDRLKAGTVYERYIGCVPDITAWVNTAKNLGYNKIILLGHSLGCSKSVKYLHVRKSHSISALVLASAADMVGNGKSDPDFSRLFSEAQENVKSGHPEKLVSKKIWDWYYLSSQTFLDLFTEGGDVDNLPILRNPEVFPEVASIKVSILNLVGEFDDIFMHSREKIWKFSNPKPSSVLRLPTRLYLGQITTMKTRKKNFQVQFWNG